MRFGTNGRGGVVEIGYGTETVVRGNVNGGIGGQRGAVLHGRKGNGNGGF